MGQYFGSDLFRVSPLPQADILGSARQAQDLQKQNLLLKAAKAQGDAAAQSVNPDGSYDNARYNKLAAANPDAHYGLQQSITENNTQQGQQTQNQNAQLELNAKRAGMMAGLVSPYLNRPNLKKSDLAPAFGAALSHGIINMDQAQKEYAALPEDADGLKKSVRGFFNAAAGPQHGYDDAFGNVQMVDDGGRLRFLKVSSPGEGGAAQDTGTGIDRTLSPGQAATPTTYRDAEGRDHTTTLGHFVGKVGTGQNRPTVPLEVMGNGRYPQQGQQQAQLGQVSNGTGEILGPAPGEVEARQAAAQASAHDASLLNQTATRRNDRQAILSNMVQDLAGFTSGPGHDTIRRYQATTNNIFGTNWKADEIENAQSFNKFAQQLADQQAAALGAGTDAKLASALHANPNSGLQKDTNQLMLHQLMGNEDAINAKATAWQKSGLSPDQYHHWNQQFSQTFDPRAYQFRRMTPNEKNKVIQGMQDSGQLEEFRHHYNAMEKAGLLTHGD